MDYKLPDGTIINLADIYEISEIKDLGSDSHTIDESTLSFTVRFKSHRSMQVTKNYHFNEWFEVFKELRKVHDDLMLQWEKYKQEHGN
ncbi:MAG TPA: hypothetical protein PLF50_00260 [Candidatus Cloacimonadota bacterium]|nr:hypothetical protein [Candidatus Cloacimonadota bacterium]